MTRRRPAIVAVALTALLAACSTVRAGERSPVPVPSTSALVTTTTAPRDRAVGLRQPTQRLRRIQVAVAGDILIHEGVWQSAAGHAGGEGYDFGPVFAGVAPVLAATDLALCHLEVPLSVDNTALSSYPRFNAPYQLADAIAGAGYDGCSVASNHTLDQGVAGIDATLHHLDRVGLGHAGAARTPEEAAAITWYQVRSMQVAHLSYTFSFNGLRPPGGQEWRSNLISVDAIAAESARARAEGADLVLLSVHWGDEYVHAPNARQRQLAAELDIRADVDLVIGHHAHVVQPVAMVGETPVIFGLGNQVSNMGQVERREGVILVVTFEAEAGEPFRFVDISVLPTIVERPGHYVRPAPADSWTRTVEHLEAEGFVTVPWPVPSG